MSDDWHSEVWLRCDYKEAGPFDMPLKEFRFVDIFGTEHSVLGKSCERHAGDASLSVHFIHPFDSTATKRLVRLPRQTANGVLEVWVESSRCW